jgi:hypothetical protein
VTGTSLFAQAVLLSDFAETKYVWLPGGVWTATETRFGSGAPSGRLPNQQTVAGWLGNGLVNTYLNGAGSTGTLTSPLFTIQRKYIRFLIGGDVSLRFSRYLKVFLKNFSPSTAISSRVGSMRRQMAALRAMRGTSKVTDSKAMSPW